MFTKVCGWIGMLLILTAYFLLANELIESRNILYHLMNVAGSLALSVELFKKKAWPAFGLQITFAFIALWTIGRFALQR